MQIFRADRNLHLANALKSWGFILLYLVLAIAIATLFFSMEMQLFAIGLILFFQLIESVAQFHVREVRLDRANDRLIVVLYCLTAGTETKTYSLHEAVPVLSANSFVSRLAGLPVTLRLAVSGKRYYRINGRYGFAPATLEGLERAINTHQATAGHESR